MTKILGTWREREREDRQGEFCEGDIEGRKGKRWRVTKREEKRKEKMEEGEDLLGENPKRKKINTRIEK